jgi:tRNA pseudouridine55 synthase
MNRGEGPSPPAFEGGRSVMRGTDRLALSGLLNVDKPAGITSRAVVDQVVRALGRVKAGHAGTLDPLATGVLVVCLGRATRLIEYVQRMPKTYRTVVRLGAVSTTLDADGEVTELEVGQVPDEAAIGAAVAGQVGTVLQRPPEFSALKREGKRAYELARAGLPVELEPRPVTIERIDVLAYAWPRLSLEVVCGSGTYIRSIARDVGEALGCGGLVEVLVRTRIGPFRQEEGVEAATLSPATIADRLLPAVAALERLPSRGISAGDVAALVQGRSLDGSDWGAGAGEIALIGPDGELAAIAERSADGRRIEPRRVFATG